MNLPENLILKQFEIGPLNNFLYFIGDEQTKEIAVVDPAWDVPFLCEEAKKNDYKITAIFLTHGHPDHVNGLDEILQTHDVPAYISKEEAPFLKPSHKNIVEISDEHILTVGNIDFECIVTAGHTPGCQSFRHKDVVLTGDALFIDGCGRVDLPGGDVQDTYYTLYEIMPTWPETNIIYPGHNYGPTPFATLESQRKTNPYLTCQSYEEFLSTRMGLSI
ncbi:MBL-fold metallo-hydrolase superfamily [hydrothermal vent metagenome]|uniref:MBL-fold metallo-hydrolase superfamily n=1 Tax=hydrothermal vent metagenome TaxID=652676 RepID=A0A3B0TRU0_9ZZZZ